MKTKSLLFILLSLVLVQSFQTQTKRKSPISTKTSVGRGTLAIEAGLIFKNGDVKPVVRTDFFLLDDDLESIIKNAKIEEKNLTGLVNASFVTKFGFWKRFPTLYSTEYPQALEAIKKHTISTMTTDFSGKGQFPPVKTGKYWLVGIGGTEQVVIWNLPIEIKVGKQTKTLDNNNSAEIL